MNMNSNHVIAEYVLVQERLFFMFHVLAKPSGEIEEIVHHQNLRLARIEESLEEIGEYFSLLLVLVPEFVGALLSPGVNVAQCADQDRILEVDVLTEALVEILTAFAQSRGRFGSSAVMFNATGVPNRKTRDSDSARPS